MLDAVAFAAERLLLTPDWRGAADEVLERLGIAAGASRALIIQNHTDERGRLLGSMRAEWCAPGIEHQWSNPFLTDAPWDELPRWVSEHSAGQPIISLVSDLPPEERAEFDEQGVLSVAEHPVFSQDEWWGAIGLDDCLEARTWGEAELQALRATATLLGAAITRQAVEDERRRAVERWGNVVGLIPAVTYSDEIDPGGEVRMGFVSPQIEEMLGYPPERFLDDAGFWFSLMHPDDRQRLNDEDAFATDDPDPFDQEYRMRHADGSYRWVHDTSTAVFDRDGLIDHFLGFMIDITERKHAEGRLRTTEERYRALVEKIPAIVYAEPMRQAPGLLYLSPQAESILGYGEQDWARGVDFWLEHLHPDDLERVRQTNIDANESHETFITEYRFRHRDGHWVWLHDEATVVHDEAGSPLFWQGMMIDITSQKQAEQDLREGERRHRTLIEHIPAVVYRESPDAAPEKFYISPRVTDVLGYSPDEWTWTEDFWKDRVHPDDQRLVFEIDDRSNETREPYEVDYRFLHGDGRWVWVRDEATFVPEADGDGYWQGFLLDITERKESESQLERALDVEREATHRLRALDEMKNTFLQAVSHDLRTPLAAILGLAITLERRDVHLEEDDARDLAHRIAGNARRLDRLVTNLLDLDRLARGIVAPKLEEVDVAELVQRVLEESQLVDDARLQIDLPSVVQPVDVAKVERIVENLLANSARHTPSGASIWVAVRPEPQGVLIVVEDGGTGVPADLRDAIFEPFRQGPDAPQHSPGVGVGLTLVRRFAELHGGRAWVQDREGGGASFRVYLPARPPKDVLPPPES